MSLAVNEQGWLTGEKVHLLPSVRCGPLSVAKPLVIVAHCTATTASAEALAKKIVNYRSHLPTCDQKTCRVHDRAASWHMLCETTGVIWQSAAFTKRTWHAGHPITVDKVRYKSANYVSIGLEFCHPGPDRRGKWAPLTLEQRARWSEIYQAITDYCGKRIPVVGHFEISGKGGHSDPGPDILKFLRTGW